jgi:hypothetical protein
VNLPIDKLVNISFSGWSYICDSLLAIGLMLVESGIAIVSKAIQYDKNSSAEFTSRKPL